MEFEGPMTRSNQKIIINNQKTLKRLIINEPMHTPIDGSLINEINLRMFCICPRNFKGEKALSGFLKRQLELKELVLVHPRKIFNI